MNLFSVKYIKLLFLVYTLAVICSFGFYLSETIPYLSVLIGGLAAMLPVPLYLYLTTRLDKATPEPKWALFGLFSFGATISFVGALIFNSLVDMAFQNDILTISVSAPIFEELMKAIPIFLFFLIFSKYFNDTMDGIIYSAVVGIGFAMSENMLYYSNAYNTYGVDKLFSVIVSRGVATVFAHPCFTMCFGLSLAYSLKTKNKNSKIVLPIIGYIFAVIFHSMWNSSILLNSNIFNMLYFVVSVPIIALIIYVYRNQKRIK